MMRKFRIFGVLLLALALFPVRSYAVDFWPNGSYWNGITSPGHYAAFVRADDIYGAAAYGLNKDPVSLSSDVKLKLSDPNYGGKFYEYAQTFYNVEGWPNMPEWVPTYVLATSVGLGQSFERVYASEVTTTLRDEALRDFERVLAGEDVGGGSGGSGPDVSNGLDIPFTWGSGNVIFSSKMKNQDAFRAASGSATLRLTSSQASDVCSYQYAVVGLVMVGGPGVSGTPSNATFVFCVFGTNNPNPSVTQNSSSMAKVQAAGGSRFDYGNNNASKILSVYNGGVFTPTYQSSSTYLTGWMLYYSVIPVGDLSPEPDGDWPEPETPATPTAPEQPTPTAPTVEPDPTVTEPTPTWPEIPTPTAPTVVTVDTPEGLDYTQLLTLINDNLNDINSYTVAINSSLNSLRSDLVTEFDGVTQGLRNIYQYLQHLDDLLERHCKHLRDALDDAVYNLELYLKRLFEWLPQQLDFDFDDSDIRYLLRRIMNKIPGNATPVTYKPNPQSDEPGFFDWLTDLWQRFLIDLVSVLPDQLGGLVDTLSQLTHYFPFSIPWDLFALLSLFAHEPVTPVFDVPLPYTSEDSATVHVDLSAWDPVAAMMRPCFLAIFCLKLALLTRDLLSGFDLSKGGV